MSENNAVKAVSASKTVFCIAIEGESVGGVDWYWKAETRAAQPRSALHVWFDLDVPASSTHDEITKLADAAMWDKSYEADREDCRFAGPFELFSVTLEWAPGDKEQGDYATDVWASSEDHAVRLVAEEMADERGSDLTSDAKRLAYIERVIDSAGSHAAERVADRLSGDLHSLLAERKDALAHVRSILGGGPVNVQRAIVRLPSEGGHGQYDLFAMAPTGMSADEAVKRLDKEIVRANREDSTSVDGVCADGLSVQQSIAKVLEREGFTFFAPATTQCWDRHVEPIDAD